MANLKGHRIIVTGGAGFIGSNLVEDLSRDNKVFVIDNMDTGSKSNLKEATKTGNVTLIEDDAKNVRKHMLDADLIFHLGQYSASPMYRKNPNLVNEVVEGTINILEYAREKGSQVVYVSTSSIYNGIKPPHREDIIPKVTDYYTEGRIAGERMCELYSRLYGVNSAAMRFFSVYGKHEEAKAGYANLITQFLWAMKKGKQPEVYGDGEQRRDFVYAGDVVEALKLASSTKGFEIYNVGTGINYSLNEMIVKLNEELGTRIKPKYLEMPVKNYVMETKADTTKAERKLGFKARVTLEEGIKLVNSK